MSVGRVLIVGTRPPPVGGVTTHVHRLWGALEARGLPLSFFDIRRDSIGTLPRLIRGASLVHLHVSRPATLLNGVALVRALGRPVVATLHSDYRAFPASGRAAIRLAARLASWIVTVNARSFEALSRVSRRVSNVTPFIAPSVDLAVTDETRSLVSTLRQGHRRVFCTNAYKHVVDRFGEELYGIQTIMTALEGAPDVAVVFCDPSGEYAASYGERGSPGPCNNMKLITYPEQFSALIGLTDGVIRATTTDGDSLSVREALHLGKDVVASDCVERPEGCRVFRTGDHAALRAVLAESPRSVSVRPQPEADGPLVDLYQRVQGRAFNVYTPSGRDEG